MRVTGIIDFLLIAALALAAGLPALDNRAPRFDENVYIAYAWGVHAHGVFGRAADADTPPPAGGGVAPLYPLALATMMHLDPGLRASLRCHLQAGPAGCSYDFIGARRLQLAFAAMMLGLLAVVLGRLVGRRTPALQTCALVIATGAPAEYANHQLTETLYPLPLMLGMAMLAIGLRRGTLAAMLGAGLLFGLAALTRPNLWYAGLLLIPVVGLARATLCDGRRWRRGLGAAAVFALALGLVCMPWLARNALAFGKPAITVGYGAQALSSRLSFNAMTGREFRAGWIYFLPDFGDSLAGRLFPAADYARLGFGNPAGFLGVERERIRDEITAATGVRPGHNVVGGPVSPVRWALGRYVLQDPWQHARVSALLAWRGLFVEKLFGLLGALALAGVILFGRNRERRLTLVLLSLPPLVLLAFNANVSVNIPRYNVILLLPMALALATVLQGAALALVRRRR